MTSISQYTQNKRFQRFWCRAIEINRHKKITIAYIKFPLLPLRSHSAVSVFDSVWTLLPDTNLNVYWHIWTKPCNMYIFLAAHYQYLKIPPKNIPKKVSVGWHWQSSKGTPHPKITTKITEIWPFRRSTMQKFVIRIWILFIF